MPDFNDMDKNLKCSARLIMCMAEDNEFAREVEEAVSDYDERHSPEIMENIGAGTSGTIRETYDTALGEIELETDYSPDQIVVRLDFTDGADEPPFETFMEALREAGYLEEEPVEHRILPMDDSDRIQLVPYGLELRMKISDSSRSEEQAIRSGPVRVGFQEVKNAIFLTFDFASETYIDVPMSVHLSPFGSDILNRFEEGEGLPLYTVLTDPEKETVHVVRQFELSTEMSNRIYDALVRQENAAFDEPYYQKVVRAMFGEYDHAGLAAKSECFCQISGREY